MRLPAVSLLLDVALRRNEESQVFSLNKVSCEGSGRFQKMLHDAHHLPGCDSKVTSSSPMTFLLCEEVKMEGGGVCLGRSIKGLKK